MRVLWLTTAALLLGSLAWGVQVEWDVQPRALSLGETAICTITVQGEDNPPPPALPPVAGLQIRAVGTQRSWSLGPQGQSSAVSFRFQIIPLQAGRFRLGPVTYAIGRERFELPPLEIEVVAGESATPGGTPRMQDLLFARVVVQPTNIFVQQVFDVIISVYSRNINLGQEIQLNNLPSVGLSLSSFQEIGAGREVVDQQVFEVRRFAAKAQALASGPLVLEPNVRVQVLVRRSRSRGWPFDDWDMPFGGSLFDPFGQFEAHPVDLKVPPLTVTVRPLPPPDNVVGFNGAVGTFSFEADAQPREVRAGDPVTLRMLIAGQGNIENVRPPAVAESAEIRVYEPRLAERRIDANRAMGQMVYEQVLIPRTGTNVVIPPLVFSYFNPVEERYETITRGPFPLTVQAVAGGTAPVVSAATPAEVKILGTDILYLKRAPRRWPPPRAKEVPPGVHVIPALAVLGAYVWARRRDRLSKDPARVRRLIAPRAARPAMRRAREALAAGDRRAFAEALMEALRAYVGNRFNLPPGALTGEEIVTRLQAAGLPADWLQKVRDLVQFCEAARYGSVETGPGDDARRWDDLREILRACERIRRK